MNHNELYGPWGREKDSYMFYDKYKKANDLLIKHTHKYYLKVNIYAYSHIHHNAMILSFLHHKYNVIIN